MRQKLIAKKDFALMANVSGAAVTKACAADKPLRAACVGRRIDAAHPAALEYVAKRQAADGEGPDPLYDLALDHCMDSGRFTQTLLVTRFDIGRTRAQRILAAFEADGILPPKRARKPKPELPAPAPPPEPRKSPGNRSSNPRGTAAARNKRMREAPVDEEVFEIPENILAFADMTLRYIVDNFGTLEKLNDVLKAVKHIEEIHERRLKSAEKEGGLVSKVHVEGVIDVFNSAHHRMLTDGATTLTAGVISKHSGGAGEVEIKLYVSDIIGSFIRPVKNQIARVLRGS